MGGSSAPSHARPLPEAFCTDARRQTRNQSPPLHHCIPYPAPSRHPPSGITPRAAHPPSASMEPKQDTHKVEETIVRATGAGAGRQQGHAEAPSDRAPWAVPRPARGRGGVGVEGQAAYGRGVGPAGGACAPRPLARARRPGAPAHPRARSRRLRTTSRRPRSRSATAMSMRARCVLGTCAQVHCSNISVLGRARTHSARPHLCTSLAGTHLLTRPAAPAPRPRASAAASRCAATTSRRRTPTPRRHRARARSTSDAAARPGCCRCCARTSPPTLARLRPLRPPAPLLLPRP